MHDGFLFAPSGIQPARYLLLTPRCPRQFGVRFFLASVIGERLGMGQQPRRLPQYLVQRGFRQFYFRAIHSLCPPVCDKTNE
jgi:hypothetical protein